MNNTNTPKPISKDLTVTQVAEILGLSKGTVKRRIYDGLLKAHKDGSAVRINEEDLRAYREQLPTIQSSNG